MADDILPRASSMRACNCEQQECQNPAHCARMTPASEVGMKHPRRAALVTKVQSRVARSAWASRCSRGSLIYDSRLYMGMHFEAVHISP